MKKEDMYTEFKREYVDDLKKTIVAFANSEGGTIFVGMEDDGSVSGVKKEEIDDVMLKITNSIRESISPDATMYTKCLIKEMDSKMIIEILVQEGDSKPYYLKNKGLKSNGVYVRQGASSVCASELMIKKMIVESDGESFEKKRSLNQELSFTSFMTACEDMELPMKENQMKTLHFYTNDSIYSNLAYLISDQCPTTTKCAVFEGKSKINFLDHQIFEGSIINQMKKTMQYVQQYNKKKSTYDSLKRIDTFDYPEVAIREAIINAIVHRDYSLGGSTLLSIFDDRIEIVSLGCLMKGISKDDLRVGVSLLRNEYLSNLFYRLQWVEAYGTGIPKIEESYRNSNVKPFIELSENAFKITLPNRNNTIITQQNLNEYESEIVKLLLESKEMRRKDIQDFLQVSQATVINNLRSLIERNVINKKGKGKQTVYFIG
ncbi:RNA-binding domain-containing protein [Amedibacillus sp. YH-ame6]